MAELTYETVLTSPRFFGLTTPTATQRAWCRIVEGLPLGELASCDDVRDAVGGEEALAILAPGAFRPREVDLLAAIRTGKSLGVAAHAFWSTQTGAVEHLRPGEVPRYVILSVNLRSAEATFTHLVGTMTNNPMLRSLIVGDPADSSIFIRHPSGRVVEVTVAAGARAGANLVSVWLLGCAFEEYPRQAGEAGGFVVNYDDQVRAAAGRVLQGGQILSVGSPWAPSGPAYDRFSTCFGRPSAERVVMKATGPAMNPTWWTPARCESLRTSNPTAFVTDVLAGFADPSSAFIPQSEVRAATRSDGPAVIPPAPSRLYVAAMDPGTRGNRWTFVIVSSRLDADGTTRFDLVLAKEWGGSPIDPLSPARVLREVKAIMAPYVRAPRVFTDQHSGDAIADLGAGIGLQVIVRTIVAGNQRDDRPANPTTVHRNDMFETLAGAFATRTISIPDDPILRNDLLSVRRVLTRAGVAYDLPETADRRHCDYAPALGLALTVFPTSRDLVDAARRVERSSHLADVLRIADGISPAEMAAAAARQEDRDHGALRAARLSTTQNETWQARNARLWDDLLARGGVETNRPSEIIDDAIRTRKVR